MPTRLRVSATLIAVLLCSLAFAEDKNASKGTLAAFVTNADTVAVVIFPDASSPVSNPNANRDAQTDVEQALTRWGRLHLSVDPQSADLVIAIRKGIPKVGPPTIQGGPVNENPVILQPQDGGIRIGGQHGRPPDLSSDPRISAPDKPQLGNSVGSSNDIFEVYRGNQKYPLDAVPVWRFYGKDGLKSPNVPAVAAFRKAMEEALKKSKTPPPAKP
jgi:hypothetical protein